MDHKTDTDSERASFETWMCDLAGYPFAGAFANLMWKAWQARASLAASAGTDCTRCSGSGEDPEGFYDQSRGDAGHTHDGPCRSCGGSGVAASAGSEPVGEVVTRHYGGDRRSIGFQEAQLYRGVRLAGGTKLYTHPSPPEGADWVDVKDQLPPPFDEVVVHPRPDDYCCEAFCDTAGNWKWADYEHNFGVHHRDCSVEYWLKLPAVPVAPPASEAKEASQ